MIEFSQSYVKKKYYLCICKLKFDHLKERNLL